MAAEPIVAKYKLELDQFKSDVEKLKGHFKEAGKAAEDSAKSASNHFNAIGSIAKSIGAGIAAAFTVREIVNFAKSSVEAFQKAEVAARKLQTAVGANGGITADFDRLIRQSAELQKQSIFGDDNIQQIQTAALQFGLTADQVEKLTPIILDFASATGQDLSTAMDAVLRGVEGNVRGLKLYGVSVGENQTRAERFATIQQQLNEKFKGQAEILGETSAGKLKKFANAWDDLKEKVGEALQPLVSGTADLLSNLVSLSETKLSESLEKERRELSATTIEILGLAVGTKERTDRIKELQAKYPGYLSNIDAEKVKNGELEKALRNVNDQLLYKIQLKKNEERLQPLLEAEQEATDRVAEARRKLADGLAKVFELSQKVASSRNREAVEELKSLDVRTQAQELLSQRIKLDGVSIGTIDRLLRSNLELKQAEIDRAAAGVEVERVQAEINAKMREFNSILQGSQPQQETANNKTLQKQIDLTQLSIEQLQKLRKERELSSTFEDKDLIERIDREIKRREEQSKQREKLDKQAEERLKKEAEVKAELAKKELQQDEDNVKLEVANRIDALKDSNKSEEELSIERTRIELFQLEQRLANFNDYVGKIEGMESRIVEVLVSIANKRLELSEKLRKADEDDFESFMKEFEKHNNEVKKSIEDLKKLRIQGEEQVRDKQIQTVGATAELHNTFTENQIRNAERQRDATIDSVDQQEQKLREDLDNKIISNEQFEKRMELLRAKRENSERELQSRINKLRARQDLITKARAVFEIGLATRQAIMNIIKEYSHLPPLMATLIGFTSGLAALQLTGALALQPPQGYYKGVRYLKRGRYPQGRDTIPIMADEGERIISKEKNLKNWKVYEAIEDERFQQYVLDNFVTPALQRYRSQREAHEKKSFAENIAQGLIFHSGEEFMSGYDFKRMWSKGIKIANMDALLQLMQQNGSPYRGGWR
ncbi:MAG: phage tail tape measure protein [Bacteroidetes bacterium]|nr:MAG: phage tail tape measure protein [Bacteroidota bacterium]REK06413.1 MAG: phage tail tape measure protein [Bacteroidota bacterium]REK33179.1 MAG: phage tail tape measure protein [Bacteroidota bacterium]